MGITLGSLFGIIFASVTAAILVACGVWAFVTTTDAYMKYAADSAIRYAKYLVTKDEEERKEIKDES